jgi:hypothetical protein
MTRFKSFESTGLAPLGRLYAGDINAIQDRYADLSGNYSQTVDVGVLRVGESALQLLLYGTGEARLSGALRTDGILRALGGLISGAFTTVQRDALPATARPFGIIILNTTLNQYEWNSGTGAAPVWKVIGVDPNLTFNFTGSDSEITFRNEDDPNNIILRAAILGEAVDRFVIRADGTMEWGPGGSTARDVKLYRAGPDILKIDDNFHAALDILARVGAVSQVKIGLQGTLAGISFGSAEDVVLRRQAADILETPDDFHFAGGILRPSSLSTAQRNALPAGRRPEGSVVYNNETKTIEVNSGTDGAPAWEPFQKTLNRPLLTIAQFQALTGVVDGQEVLVDVGNNITWRLRYKAAVGDAYKWIPVGQQLPARNESASTITLGNNAGNWVVVLSVGAPLSGFYYGVFCFKKMWTSGGNYTGPVYISFSFNGVIDQSDGLVETGSAIGNAGWDDNIGNMERLLKSTYQRALAAGQLMSLVKYQGSGADSMTFSYPFVELIPMRISQ